MRAISGVLKLEDCELCVEYKDPDYEVYSYSLGDGLWGLTALDDEEVDEFVRLFGLDLVSKAYNGEELVVSVPISFITSKGHSVINRKNKSEFLGNRDVEEMIFNGCWYDDDGNPKELDSEDSPLMRNGLI